MSLEPSTQRRRKKKIKRRSDRFFLCARFPAAPAKRAKAAASNGSAPASERARVMAAAVAVSPGACQSAPGRIFHHDRTPSHNRSRLPPLLPRIFNDGRTGFARAPRDGARAHRVVASSDPDARSSGYAPGSPLQFSRLAIVYTLFSSPHDFMGTFRHSVPLEMETLRGSSSRALGVAFSCVARRLLARAAGEAVSVCAPAGDRWRAGGVYWAKTNLRLVLLKPCLFGSLRVSPL